jgi:hypothetical protein
MFWNPSQAILEKRRQAWLKISARGEVRFVLLRGVLGYGVLVFGLDTLYSLFINHDRRCLEPFNLIWSVMTWLVVGLGFGLFMWFSGQKFLCSGKGLPASPPTAQNSQLDLPT